MDIKAKLFETIDFCSERHCISSGTQFMTLHAPIKQSSAIKQVGLTYGSDLIWDKVFVLSD